MLMGSHTSLVPTSCVVPQVKDVWSFVEEQRADTFEDLKDAAVAIFGDALLDDDEVTPQLMVKMLLIQMNHKTPHRRLRVLSSTEQKDLNAVANAFLELCDQSETDAYWVFEFFVVRYGILETSHETEVCVP
ncbi:hypothetical protein HK104_000598 [Borealophlyctis nickersoniae]|nr:hypothetical protein HK104_000598 [Borealophlyctis nickersoniae]